MQLQQLLELTVVRLSATSSATKAQFNLSYTGANSVHRIALVHVSHAEH